MELELAPAALESVQLGDADLQVDVHVLRAALATTADPQPGRAPTTKLEGQARLALKSGCVYEGQLVNGRMHGQGKLTFPDGLVYEGSFQHNTIHGQGTYRWPGGAVYEGEVAEGLRHGQGVMVFADSPARYEGQWQRGNRHGQGRITLDAEGKHWYQGAWEDDRKHGHGVMHYANGDEFVGEWRDDVKHGRGMMEWASRRQRYEGCWARNKPNGPGTHVWFKQLVTEPSPANHAMLLQFNRYEGHFLEGQRSGYGVLHYATGARYEGCWEADLKHGPGVFVFENGEVWQGQFHEDQPVLHEGQTFAPSSPGVSMQVDDLVDEEEQPSAAARGLANVLMVYNTDLRALYDKYCKRPSLHLRGRSKPCFTMVTCQIWELLGDVRLITAATPLARCNQLLAQARRPPPPLESFRRTMRAALCDAEDPEQGAWWDALAAEHASAGPHAPMQELLFPAFCEFLVRLAATRYRHVPALERRLHALINVHLLHQVSKAKATLPPPPRTPFHLEMWAGNATSVLKASDQLLRAAWAGLSDLPSASATGAQAAVGAAATASDGAEPEAEEEDLERKVAQLAGKVTDKDLYAQVFTVRQALQLLQRLGVVGGAGVAMQAAAAMTFNYLTVNTYTYETHKPKVGMEEAVSPEIAAPPPSDSGSAPAGDAAGASGADAQGGEAGVADLPEADAREVLCWLDQPLIYADWVEGLARVAQVLVAPASLAPPEHAAQQEPADGAAAAAPAPSDGSGGDAAAAKAAPAGSGEGVLHQQLRVFLTGPQGLRRALLDAFAA